MAVNGAGEALLGLSLGYSGTQDNGNVLDQYITAPEFYAVQSYGYLPLNKSTDFFRKR